MDGMGRLRGVPRLKTATAVICVLLLCCSCVETTTWIGAAAPKPDATAQSGDPPASADAGSVAEEPPWRCALPVPGARTLETPSQVSAPNQKSVVRTL